MDDTNKKVLQKYAELARVQVDATVQQNIRAIQQRNKRWNQERYGCPDCAAARCYRTCPRYLSHCESEEFFRWWARTSPPDRVGKDYLQQIPAPPARKSKNKSDKRTNKKPTFENLYFEC